MKILEGKEKAWAAALLGLLSAYITGDGSLSQDVVDAFTGQSADLVSTLIVAGLSYLGVYSVANTQPKPPVEYARTQDHEFPVVDLEGE